MKNAPSMKHRVRDLAHSLGYTIIPNWQKDSFQNADYLRKLLAYLNIDCVVDVGANAGQYRKFLVEEVGYEGLVVSFEPVPALASQLRRAAAGSKTWLVEACALGREPGNMTFNVMANTEFSSFLSPLDDQTSSFKGANKVKESVAVEVATLDQVVPRLRAQHGARNIYLKLDTQGYDLEVLKGAELSLPTIGGLQSEMSVRPIYAGMPRYSEVISYLEERGFVMSGIFPNNAGHFPLLIEFDCYMIRPKA